MKKFILLFLGFTFFSTTVFTKEKPEIMFLGFAINFNTCALRVIDAGYKTVRYGGYVNGFYRPDACYGLDPKVEGPNPSPTPGPNPLTENIHFTYSQSKDLYVKLQADKAYESLLPRAEKLESALDVLYSAAEDGMSKTGMLPFYRDVKFEYEMFAYDFYPIHVKAESTLIGNVWKKFVKAFEQLKKEFESND